MVGMILCGTDFSLPAREAQRAAAALARKRGVALLLVTVLPRDDSAARAEAVGQLEHEADELRQGYELGVETLVAVASSPAAELLRLVKARDASLVVVGTARSEGSAPLGVVTEHLCRHAEVPVFIARDPASLVAWCRGQCLLRALVGSGLGDASRSALAHVGAWPDMAVTVVHVAWPYGEHYRLGVAGRPAHEHLAPEVEHQLLGDLAYWAMRANCLTTPKLRVVAGWGRIDAHLAQIAVEKEADVLVVGTHERNLHEPTWQASVTRHAIHGVRSNVLCVPERYLPLQRTPAPRLIVVPTDFGLASARAISVAASLLEQRGSLHLIHVTSTLTDDTRAELMSKLEASVPEDLGAHVTCQLRLLQGAPIWLTVWQHAERVRADLICMAAHSSGPEFVVGNQAKTILQHAHMPVVLVPPDRES
jgi:nucleotide-binding universal stress UspA family protein